MSQPFIGEIVLFGGNFAPRGWAFCWGQTLSIAQNTALFSILGTTYGGNGQVTFALPDLRGRTAIGWGQGSGLPDVSLGEAAGSPSHVLTTNEMPIHAHSVSVPVSTADATSKNPSGRVPAGTASPVYADAANATGLAGTSGTAGGSQPFSTMPPYLGLSYIIALQGVFPSRN